MGRRPAGLVLPSSRLAVDMPPSSPGHHISRTALTLSIQCSATGWLVLRTTLVLGLTAATSSTSLSWSPGRPNTGSRRVQRKTTATLAFFAAAMAASWSDWRCSRVYQLRRTWTGEFDESGLVLI